METQPQDEVQRSGMAVAYVLERLITEFIADVRAWAGLQVYDQRDPGGRIVSYGYHWHEPNGEGDCDNLIVYGYPTPPAAVSAGFKAGCGKGQLDMPGAKGALTERMVMRCHVKG
jgi:hypothetical protein